MHRLRFLGHRRAPITAIVSIAAVLTFLLSGSASAAGTTAAPSQHALSVAASASTPYVTGASVYNHRDSLIRYSGALNVFAMANDGKDQSTDFSIGELVTATDREGNIGAAIAVAQTNFDNYTTHDAHFSIGGVGVSGFQFYGEKTKVLIPPAQPTSKVTEKVVLPESALVVVVALSGGQTSIVLRGIPGLVIDANGTGANWSGVMIGQAQLNAGTYTVTETTTNHDAGGLNRTDVVGIFAFSNSRVGFIDKRLPIRVVATIPVGGDPNGMAYDSARGEVFVADSDSNNVSVINDTTNRVVATIPVVSSPFGITYDSGKGEVYVANCGPPNVVSVISDRTNTVVATIPVTPASTCPTSTAYDSGKGEIFVGSYSYGYYEPSKVYAISDATNKVVATITVRGPVWNVAYDSGKGEVFATIPWGNDYPPSVVVISDRTNKVVAKLGSSYYGVEAEGLAYDSGKGEVLVAYYFPSEVEVISDVTDKVVAVIHMGTWVEPLAVAYDSAKGEIFVTDWGSDAVTVISDTTNKVVAYIHPEGYSQGLNYAQGLVYDSGTQNVFESYFSYLGVGGQVNVISD
jgi:YVTN family beta-propeller protein